MRKIKPYSPTWQKLANRDARAFCPTIYACKKCTYPVISGYCCSYCGDTNPSRAEEEDKKDLGNG